MPIEINEESQGGIVKKNVKNCNFQYLKHDNFVLVGGMVKYFVKKYSIIDGLYTGIIRIQLALIVVELNKKKQEDMVEIIGKD